VVYSVLNAHNKQGSIFVPLSIILEKVSRIALVLLSALLAYQISLFTWSLFPQQNTEYQRFPAKGKAVKDNSKLDTRKLQQQHLFGKQIASKKRAEKKLPVSVAPKTKLNLLLVGVVAASDPLYSSAIISYQSQQGSYFIDSKIAGTGAAISEIHADRVILNVNGALQTLMLDGIENPEQRQGNRKSKAQTKSSRSAAKHESKQVDLDRQALLKDPGKLTDYIRISPYRKDGKVAGYRIKPGKDSSLFKQAGLKSNDLAIELNGIDLTDTQQAFSLMKEFPTMTEISLTVERNGQLHELYFNIP